MNYSKTSMCYLNILPPRIRQLVYDFDGRYKTAKNQCIEMIKQRGQTPVGIWGSGNKHCSEYHTLHTYDLKTMHICFPNYYEDVNRRLKRYRSLLEPNGRIRGITDHLTRVPKNYYFKDVMGIYKIGMDFERVVIDGKLYKSDEKVMTVNFDCMCVMPSQPKIKVIDVLDPLFIKSIKARGQKRTKMFRDLGISENGIPGRDLYFEPITIDGKDYFVENKVMTVGGHIRKTRSSSVLGHINYQGIIKWFGDKR